MPIAETAAARSRPVGASYSFFMIDLEGAPTLGFARAQKYDVESIEERAAEIG